MRTPTSDRTKVAASAKAAAAKPAAPVKVADAEASGVMWPVRVADNDRVPLDMALGYASPKALETGTAMRPESTGSAPARITPVAAFKPMPQNARRTAACRCGHHQHGHHQHDHGHEEDHRPHRCARSRRQELRHRRERTRHVVGVAAAARETEEPFIAPATRATGGTITTRVITNPLRYDDPWLRAMIMTPSISDAMTATLYGRPDLGELRNLMRKPRASLMLSFSEDPFSGPAPDQFRGEAVVFMDNHAFEKRTASLK